MANLFNISVKPEIAAAVEKIEANTDLLDLVRETDVVNLASGINTNTSNLNTIINTKLPAILTNVGVNTTALTTIAGIVDAIKTKTDATPQNVRGENKSAWLGTEETTFQDVVNLTGHGKLNKLGIGVWNAANIVHVHIEIDSIDYGSCSHTGDLLAFICIPSFLDGNYGLELRTIDGTNADNNLFNIEFQESLLVQIKLEGTTATRTVGCGVNYNLDTF